jgi:hypothetical protein
MALIANQTPNSTGVVVTYAAAALTNTVANLGRTIVLVKNDSVASINATLKSRLSVDGNVVPDKVIAVAAGTEKVIGPFPPGIYNDADGLVQIDISVITTVGIAVIQVP